MSDSEYIKERRMPPLEKARLRAKEPPACKDCPESERVGKVLYCKISGKMILPQYENISCCRGERLKGD
jgi:hypothetical protein